MINTDIPLTPVEEIRNAGCSLKVKNGVYHIVCGEHLLYVGEAEGMRAWWDEIKLAKARIKSAKARIKTVKATTKTTVYNLDDDTEVVYNTDSYTALVMAYEIGRNAGSWEYKSVTEYPIKTVNGRTLILGNFTCAK